MMKQIIFSILILVLLTGCTISEKITSFRLNYDPFLKTTDVFEDYSFHEMPNGQVIQLKIAKTPAEQKQGLSNIEKIDGYEGLLFVFEKPKQAKIWMKDMKFALDLIYLDKNMRVIEIYKNQQPCEHECPIIYSKENNIQYVLEIPASMAIRYQLTLNSQIK